MPIPWLIGAAVLGIGAAIAAAVSDDDKPSSNSSNGDDAEQRRRREAAEKARLKREREEKIASAQALFKERGEQQGASLRKALDELVKLHGDVFGARLVQGRAVVPDEIEANTTRLAMTIRKAFVHMPDDIERIIANLAFYSTVYHRDAAMAPSPQLMQLLSPAHDAFDQLQKLGKAEDRLRALQRQLAKAA